MKRAILLLPLITLFLSVSFPVSAHMGTGSCITLEPDNDSCVLNPYVAIYILCKKLFGSPELPPQYRYSHIETAVVGGRKIDFRGEIQYFNGSKIVQAGTLARPAEFTVGNSKYLFGKKEYYSRLTYTGLTGYANQNIQDDYELNSVTFYYNGHVESGHTIPEIILSIPNGYLGMKPGAELKFLSDGEMAIALSYSEYNDLHWGELNLKAGAVFFDRRKLPKAARIESDHYAAFGVESVIFPRPSFLVFSDDGMKATVLTTKPFMMREGKGISSFDISAEGDVSFPDSSLKPKEEYSKAEWECGFRMMEDRRKSFSQ